MPFVNKNKFYASTVYILIIVIILTINLDYTDIILLDLFFEVDSPNNIKLICYNEVNRSIYHFSWGRSEFDSLF